MFIIVIVIVIVKVMIIRRAVLSTLILMIMISLLRPDATLSVPFLLCAPDKLQKIKHFASRSPRRSSCCDYERVRDHDLGPGQQQCKSSELAWQCAAHSLEAVMSNQHYGTQYFPAFGCLLAFLVLFPTLRSEMCAGPCSVAEVLKAPISLAGARAVAVVRAIRIA